MSLEQSMVQLYAHAERHRYPFSDRDNARADRRRRRTNARGSEKEGEEWAVGRRVVTKEQLRAHLLTAALSLDGRRRRVLVLRRERDGIALFELLGRGARCGPVGADRLARDEPVDLLEDRLEGRAHVAVGQGGRLDEEKFVLESKSR